MWVENSNKHNTPSSYFIYINIDNKSKRLIVPRSSYFHLK